MDFLDLRQDKDTNTKPKQDNEFVDQAIDLMTGIQETTKEEPGELMGGDNEIIDLTGEEKDTDELMGGDNNMMYFTL